MESSLSEQDTFSSGNAVYVIGLIGVAGVSLLRKVLLDIGLMRLLEPIRLDLWRLGYDLFFALVLPCVGIVCYVHTRRLALPRWLMVTRWVVGAYLAYTVVKGGFRLLFLGLDVAGLLPDSYPVVRGGIWLVCAMASIGVIGAALRYPQWRLCVSPFLFGPDAVEHLVGRDSSCSVCRLSPIAPAGVHDFCDGVFGVGLLHAVSPPGACLVVGGVGRDRVVHRRSLPAARANVAEDV